MLPQEMFRNQVLWDRFWSHFGTEKQGYGGYMIRELLHPVFGCPFVSSKSADIEFAREGTAVTDYMQF